MKRLHNLMILLALPALSFGAVQIVASLTGRVLDQATGQPLEGVNVMIVGSSLGDATDSAGQFVIKGLGRSSGELRLLISAIGYEDQRLAVRLPATEALEIVLRETFFQMDELVVTGTRTAKVLVNTPIATEVISRQDIIDSGARDMSELLEQRSGVVISPGVDGGQTASLLGIDAKYILVLIDGQPVTGKFNGRIPLDQISTAVVDKVEIVKGPSSAVYGSEAMGGVINIITSTGISRPIFTARTRYTGSDEALNLLDAGQGKRDLRINVDRQRGSLRWQLDVDGAKANIDKSIKYIDIDNFSNLSLRGAADWEVSATQALSVRFSRFDTDEVSSLAGVTTASTRITRSSASLVHALRVGSNWSLRSVGRLNSYSRDFTRPVQDERNLTAETEGEIELTLVRQVTGLTISSGAELNLATYENDRVLGAERSLNSAGLYLQAEWEPTPLFTVVAGSRIDANNEIDPIIAPRLAMMYTWRERWKWRAAWGTGFRMPSFMDRYIDWTHVQYGYSIAGNPNLLPERSNGVNASVEYYHPGQYQVTAAIYWNRFTNMIEDVLVGTGLFSYENIDKVDFRGMELQARWHLSQSWLASWGYNFVLNKNLVSDQPIPNTQPHTASFRLSHKHGGGRFGYALKAKVVGPYRPVFYDPETQIFREADQQLATSLTLDWDANFSLTSWAGVAFGMRNMLDYKNDEFGPYVGRTFYIELKTLLN